MKKMLGITLGLVGFGLLLAGCDSSSGGTAVSNDDLVGKWVINKEVTKGFFSYTPTGGQEFKINIDTTQTYTGSDYYVEFKADKSYSANYPSSNQTTKRSAASAVETGTWSISGNTVTTISSVGDTSAVQAAISGKSGTFTVSLHETMNDSDGVYVNSIDATISATKQ